MAGRALAAARQALPALCAGRAPGHNVRMPNIASVLKEEVTRLARKEVRAATAALKKAVVAYRADIAELKRRSGALEKQLRRLARM